MNRWYLVVAVALCVVLVVAAHFSNLYIVSKHNTADPMRYGSHLEPAYTAQDAASVHDNRESIYQTVYAEAYGKDVLVREHEESSFMPSDDMVFLKKNGGKFVIVYLHVDRPLIVYSSAAWMSDLRPAHLDPADYHDVKPRRCEIEISPVLAKSIVADWHAVLMQTRYDTHPRQGMDGSNYEFSMPTDQRELAGQIWTPDVDTSPGMLVAVAHDMAGYCIKKSQETKARLTAAVDEISREMDTP